MKIGMAGGVAVLVLLVVVVIVAAYFLSGKEKLKERVRCVSEVPIYQDGSAAFDENRINILILGIDKEEEMPKPDDNSGSLGQADAIFVVSMDLENSQTSVLSIPRDTMVKIQTYDAEGRYSGFRKAQLCLQYAYGDGQSLSCELMQKRVEELLGIPLHGYVALNLEMIPTLNDAVGGVDLTMDEDYTFINPAFEKGAVLHLMGNEARDYLQIRDIQVAGSAYQRLNRHKQYIQAFYQQAQSKALENPLTIISLMQTLPDYMETDLETNEIISLIQMGMDCSFDEVSFRILEGEIVQGAIYEEYYVKQEELEKLVKEMFYSED